MRYQKSATTSTKQLTKFAMIEIPIIEIAVVPLINSYLYIIPEILR